VSSNNPEHQFMALLWFPPCKVSSLCPWSFFLPCSSLSVVRLPGIAAAGAAYRDGT
jgi:hypothetical protein